VAALHIDVLTLFPSYFQGPLEESLLKKAREKRLLEVAVHDLRDYTHDRHKTADDKPFGGGPGMVMKPEPVFECVEAIQDKGAAKGWVILLDAKGESFSQKMARSLADKKRLILIAGHYEGIDHRVAEGLADQIVSLGDFITMGGEAVALCMIEAVARLVPGVVGNEASLEDESFEMGGLEYPQYTRPREYRGMKVPEVLISGHHAEVRAWRLAKAREATRRSRPDLISGDAPQDKNRNSKIDTKARAKK
jgi:tRNA (guanine37-N1)-methyltransferase